ncbi:hypothetical protein RND71_021174 [Anisodus tanguticus]|uniref:Uncharacterized protein n=1 Tax=Anisodus tanguticus TaxID=243964 RepID=A0AAE1VFW3_9SOLA|nr:hypothetical protein RND71_021174 [Anisodus tanguticus]
MISSGCNMCLKRLILDGCDSIDDISPDLVKRTHYLRVVCCHLLTWLLILTETEYLSISECENLEVLSVVYGTQTIDEEILDDENWELPCSIRRLTISKLKTLSSQILKSLTSLESLYTKNLPQIQSLLEEELPSSLSELTLFDHHELHSLPTEGLRHHTSLQRLYIHNFPNLQSLPESGMPSSLSVLSISNCPNPPSLPVKRMSSSISTLSISNCPLLTPLLEFDKGEYWPNIDQIPTIKIDRKYQ